MGALAGWINENYGAERGGTALFRIYQTLDEVNQKFGVGRIIHWESGSSYEEARMFFRTNNDEGRPVEYSIDDEGIAWVEEIMTYRVKRTLVDVLLNRGNEFRVKLGVTRSAEIEIEDFCDKYGELLEATLTDMDEGASRLVKLRRRLANL